MTETEVLDRAATVHRGRRLEYFTIAWNALEGLVAVVAGAIAGSISLVGFGIDSFVEVTSGSVLLWRMSVDAEERDRERNEKRALKVVGACFLTLSGYITYEAITDLVVQTCPRAQHSGHPSGLRFARRDATSFACETKSGTRARQCGDAR